VQPSLFDPGPQFDRRGLADKVRAQAERSIFISTSSWRYEGWLNQIYTPERYFTRGRFSKKKFHGSEDFAPKRRFRDRVKREVSAHRISVLLVEFGTFSKASYADANLFFEDLRQFLRNLQAGSNRAYASAFPSEGAYLTALATGFIPMYTCSWEARNGNFSLLQSRRTVIFVTPGAVCRNGYR
jgi:hypothetical protein